MTTFLCDAAGRHDHASRGDVARIFALSDRQSELLWHLVETGGLREAAGAMGCSYVSARNMLAEIKTKFGLDTIPMLVGQTLAMSDDRDVGAAFHDLFGLTDRQFAIARATAVRKSRAEIAEALGLSDAVVDAEMKNIHLILGASNAAEIVRLVSAALSHGQVDAEPEVSILGGHVLPGASILVDGRTVAYSDYGPAGGRAVLILHSTITARAPPTRLVRALWRQGFRTLAIDRPGFGDSDAARDPSPPYRTASDDVAALCRTLGIERIDLIARGSGQAAVSLAHHHPDLVDRAILVNPTPAIAHTPHDRGPLGIVKRRFAANPALIELTIRTLARFGTATRLRDGMIRSFRDSAPDLALAESDPQFIADYLRATRDFGRGRIRGYVEEQRAWATGFDVAPLPGKDRWRIIQAADYVLHAPEAAIGYWRARLPDTPLQRIEGAGQMLAYSHPDHVADALGPA